MTIIVFEKLALAVFASFGEERIENDMLCLGIKDEDGKPIKVNVHINGHILEVDGTRKIKTSVLTKGVQTVEVSYARQRLSVGRIHLEQSIITLIPHNQHEILVKTATAAERATKLSLSFEKRICELEKAYNGSDITNLT